MGNQDEKNKDVKSKIEQIRIDLEKKLSAIEKSKIDTPIVEKSENDIKKSVVVNKEVKLENQVKPVFEITEPIESIKEEKIVPKVKQAIIVSKDTSKKEVNIIATEKSNKVVSNITKTAIVSKASDSKKVVLPTETNSKISTPPKTVISSLATSKTEIKPLDEVVEYEEKSKRGILSYLIYGLVIAFFLVLGYMFLDYMKEDKKVKNEIMEQKLSEFKNKRYLDSIELADLNYQLLDLQSKKMIDSLDLIYEKELLANSNLKDKKTAKRNFILNNPKNVEKRAARESKKNTDMPKGNDVADGNNSNDNGLNSSTKKTDDLVANTDTTINNNIEETESEKKTASTENLSKETDKALAEVAKKKKVIKSPIYPGCEKKKTELDRKKCFTSKMYRHVSKKFNSSLAQDIGLSDGMHQVRVNYIIDKSGYATVLNVRAENKKLEQEAVRVIQSLPKMKPGTVDGKKSKLQYNIPIKFMVNN